jgi:hypothetical protein
MRGMGESLARQSSFMFGRFIELADPTIGHLSLWSQIAEVFSTAGISGSSAASAGRRGSWNAIFVEINFNVG